MCKRLKSLGLDVGTTTTQLVVSELTVENRASAFAVPDMAITERKILYESPVHFTPLLSADRIDGDALGALLEEEYRRAGICRRDVDTGAVIITGETSRRENAAAVLRALSERAGDFVVTTAGPDLESRLAARGAGAVEFSKGSHRPVLHMDIGGGTANLALLEDGKILRTGCLNIGGRLIKYDKNKKITYISPVLKGFTPLQIGDCATREALTPICRLLAAALESAAGRSTEPIPEALQTREAAKAWTPPDRPVTVSFSGGVADCIEAERSWDAFGDLGVLLGQAVSQSALCRESYTLGAQTIRATVIGAGCHATRLSGSTVYSQNLTFPLKNLPVVRLSHPKAIADALKAQDGPCILSLALPIQSYSQLKDTAAAIAGQWSEPLLCLEADMAKALGQLLALALPPEAPILCIDRLRLDEGDYLDVGAPTGDAFPVVVKTLVLR